MARRLLPAVAAAVVVPFGVSAAAFAPPHAHRSTTEHHAGVVTHSHFEPHHLSSHHTEGAEIEPSDDDVVWLDGAIAYAVPYSLSSLAADVAGHVEPTPASRSWSVIIFDDAAPPHGPPRRSSTLRGPPIFPV